MKLTLEKKKKLQAILGAISTPGEKAELQKLDALKVKEIVEFFNTVELENDSRIDRMERNFAGILSSFEAYRKASGAHSKYLVETFGNFSENMIEKIGELGGTISTSFEKNKPINTAGVYKDMINQLSAINKSVVDKPVPVWNWPQYASVGVRNRSFSNVDPAVDSMDMGEYDYVSMALSGANTTENYTFKQNGASGSTVATVVVVYTNSTRNVLVSVTKTPVVQTL